ncbi:hypothetical protein ABIE44_003397 [Marmoricola sp. OAE513]|uniref:DUF5994 family protein n=1 Tax=Marmoricola sp. OAE513 TaxID=2817894 RepID=UPI001AEB8129
MAAQTARRFTHGVRPAGDPRFRDVPDGAWWPHNRQLTEQLQHLFDSWPPDQPRINRVLYSPPDWDDKPRKVPVNGRWVKTGHFPNDDTHTITLTLSDRSRQVISVIDPGTATDAATKILDDLHRSTP